MLPNSEPTTYTIACPPQDKKLEGKGPPTDKHLPQSPFVGYFSDEELCISFYESSMLGRKKVFTVPATTTHNLLLMRTNHFYLNIGHLAYKLMHLP
jgi:hypothetical protein